MDCFKAETQSHIKSLGTQLHVLKHVSVTTLENRVRRLEYLAVLLSLLCVILLIRGML